MILSCNSVTGYPTSGLYCSRNRKGYKNFFQLVIGPLSLNHSYHFRYATKNPSLAVQFLEDCAFMGKVDYGMRFLEVVREKEPDIKGCNSIEKLRIQLFLQ